ncbi:MAG: RHS repeat-associated core domain-containing protein, partial [bacterium]|nr:RHS repeat-associated core domain-containing protein [bacterium]
MADPLAYQPIVTPRGFTGHEHLDAVGLVHMNGRVYDPELGRFLSADPFVQDATDLQSLNRYTYVLNNPLSLTDASGFFFEALFAGFIGLFEAVYEAVQFIAKAVLGPILDVPVLGTIFQAVYTAAACFYGGPAGCAAAAVLFTAARGGSLMAAFKAGAFAFAGAALFGPLPLDAPFWAHAVNALRSGLFQGGVNELSGGSFVEGFIAGAVSAGARSLGGRLFPGDTGDAIAGRVALASAAGGATSKVLGGKFENGALTAAFVALYVEYQSGSFDGA